MNKRLKSTVIASLLPLFLLSSLVHAEGACQPCGEMITNMPLPSYESHPVQPLQNYIATYSECALNSGCSGFYIGTGFGYGRLDFDIDIPGIDFPTVTDNYITEYITAGYAFTYSSFFLATELGFYYNSPSRGLHYKDPSARFTITFPEIGPITLRADTIRLDINSSSHGAFDLLPGFSFGRRFTIFARAGVEVASYSWERRFGVPEVDVIPLPFVPPIVIARDVEIKDNQDATAIAFRLGAGISFIACRYVSFTANYIHKFNSSLDFSPNITLLTHAQPGVDTATTLTTLQTANHFHPHAEEILFGVNFTF